jgi:asparagine synthase (glutamine-hydrolysing)
MCGIAGFADFNKKTNEEQLAKMSCALPHRGPDGQGVFFHEGPNAHVGLGHRRLSIIDLSAAANQPMHYKSWHLIFNGEIYNYNEVREELIKLGHQFHTHSDTEVILHCWEEWGEKSMERWRGMYAIVIFDENRQELICIRDRAGVKPFHYYWNNDLFLFASELKALVAHPDFLKYVNRDAVASFLQYGYVSSPHCIYNHTHLLPGTGMYMTIIISQN